MIEGAVRSLATKGRGVWGKGAPEGTAGWDSGKGALGGVEGAGRSGRRKGEGFGERGRRAVRRAGIYRPSWWSKMVQNSIFGVFFLKCFSRRLWLAFSEFFLCF